MPKSRPPPVFTGAGSAGLPAPDGRAGSHRTDSGRAGSGMAVLLSAEGRQFEPTAQAIRNWVAQADRDEGRRADGLSSAEREEIRRLRCENRRLREEREWRFSCLPKVDRYWQKPRPGLLGRSDPGGLPVHESESGPVPHRHDGPGARSLPERVRCVASTRGFGTRAQRRSPHCPRAGDSRAQPGELRGTADSSRAG